MWAGCGGDDSSRAPILQVFVRDVADTDDPIGHEYALTYGVHPNAYRCAADATCPRYEGFICDTNPKNLTFNHCVMDGMLPRALFAEARAPSIRIVSKEPLDVKSVELFSCACGPCPPGDATCGCPAGGAWTPDPGNCSKCGDDPATAADEAGRCLDLDGDGKPDVTMLQAGLATISCTLPAFAPYSTLEGDGYYDPTGSQVPTSRGGYGGIGPALVLEPHIQLPTSTACTVAVSPKIVDLHGGKVQATDGPISFRTEPLGVERTVPARGDAAVSVKLDRITVTYNVDLAPSTIDARTVSLSGKTGEPVAGAGAAPGERKEKDTIVITPPPGGLAACRTYVVTVTGDVADSYGVPRPAGLPPVDGQCDPASPPGGCAFSFTTGAADGTSLCADIT